MNEEQQDEHEVLRELSRLYRGVEHRIRRLLGPVTPDEEAQAVRDATATSPEQERAARTARQVMYRLAEQQDRPEPPGGGRGPPPEE